MENQYQTYVQTLRFDNAKEYMSHQVQKYLDAKDIMHETFCSYTTPQNGVVEQKDHLLLEVTEPFCFTYKLRDFGVNQWLQVCLLYQSYAYPILKGKPLYHCYPI